MRTLFPTIDDVKGIIGWGWLFALPNGFAWHALMDQGGSMSGFHQGQWVGLVVGVVIGITIHIKERQHEDRI